VLVLAACGGERGVGADGDAVLEVTSHVLAEGEQVPVEHTCDGTDEPPELAWSAVPAEAEEKLVVVDDPDAPGGTFTHWTVCGLDRDGSASARKGGGRTAFTTDRSVWDSERVAVVPGR
jgi:phosphatidylethanolamine-binding protein (PEBP) family uncharacterized protein